MLSCPLAPARFLARTALLGLGLLAALPLASTTTLPLPFGRAEAADLKIASVDYQRALENVSEGESARKKLESMFQAKKVAIEKMKTNLDAMQADYQKQSVLLSDSAKREKEDAINLAGMQFQQAYEVRCIVVERPTANHPVGAAPPPRARPRRQDGLDAPRHVVG